MEEWRRVEGWEGYEVSNTGRLRSWKACRRSPDEELPRIVRGYYLPTGYHYVDMKDRGRKRKTALHTLVAEAFLGARPEGAQVAHHNGNPRDNNVNNLRWATPVENMADAKRHGTVRAGSAHHAALLTEEQVLWARACGLPVADIARQLGVKYHVAYNLMRGTTYRAQADGRGLLAPGQVGLFGGGR